MKFIKHGDIYKVMRITGPSHNMLGVIFSKNAATDIRITSLESALCQENVTSEIVQREVLEGLKEINEELKANYNIQEIFYVPSDSREQNIYKELVKEIIRKKHNNEY